MTDNTVLLTTHDIARHYRHHGDTVTALQPTSLAVRRGEFIAITGPSGSGKSTLCALLAGWDQPDAGHLDLTDGTDVVFTPQRVVLFDTLTVTENLELAGNIDPTLLDRLHIAELADRFPAEASLGERQRIALARAITSRADMLILDEPTAHQDTTTTQAVINALTTAAAAGITVVAATHDPALATAARRTIALAPTTVPSGT